MRSELIRIVNLAEYGGVRFPAVKTSAFTVSL
jgi:hypothetical protein